MILSKVTQKKTNSNNKNDFKYQNAQTIYKSILIIKFQLDQSRIIQLIIRKLKSQPQLQDKLIVVNPLMDYISILKQRKSAILACTTSQTVPQQQRQILKKSLTNMNYASLASKLIIGLTIFSAVNWKKQVPIMRREVPIAILALGVSALADYGISEYVWKQSSDIVQKYTGFQNGVYVSPQKMGAMTSMYNSKNKQNALIEVQIQDDDQ